jgi:hypothetical protein
MRPERGCFQDKNNGFKCNLGALVAVMAGITATAVNADSNFVFVYHFVDFETRSRQ